MFSPKRSRWPPNFFTFLTSLTHYLSMIKVSEKKSMLEKFCATVLKASSFNLFFFFFFIITTGLGRIFPSHSPRKSYSSCSKTEYSRVYVDSSQEPPTITVSIILFFCQLHCIMISVAIPFLLLGTKVLEVFFFFFLLSLTVFRAFVPLLVCKSCNAVIKSLVPAITLGIILGYDCVLFFSDTRWCKNRQVSINWEWMGPTQGPTA